jgi:hypothetical protein
VPAFDPGWEKHQGHERNCSGMICFCFFPPREAGEGDSRRLLSFWGGEGSRISLRTKVPSWQIPAGDFSQIRMPVR